MVRYWRRERGAGMWRTRIWFWGPQRRWDGWKTLVPFVYGHDQYARRVLVIGWTVTGRVCVAVWGCGDAVCVAETARDKMVMERALRARRGK